MDPKIYGRRCSATIVLVAGASAVKMPLPWMCYYAKFGRSLCGYK